MMRFLFFLATVSWIGSGIALAVFLYDPEAATGTALVLTALSVLHGSVAFSAGAIVRAIKPVQAPEEIRAGSDVES